MPPKAAPGELGRGRSGGRGRVGGPSRASGGRGGGRGSGPGHNGPPTPGSPPRSRGPPSRATAIPISGGPAGLTPATHVRAIGARRPGQGTAGWPVNVLTNTFATELNQGTIHHYDGMYLGLFRQELLNSAATCSFTLQSVCALFAAQIVHR